MIIFLDFFNYLLNFLSEISMLELEQVGTSMVRKVLLLSCRVRLVFCLSAAAGCHSAPKAVSVDAVSSVCAGNADTAPNIPTPAVGIHLGLPASTD